MYITLIHPHHSWRRTAVGSPSASAAAADHGRFAHESLRRPVDRCFHVVVDPSRTQQPVRAALENRDARLGWQVVAPQRTQLYSRAQRTPSSVTAQCCRPVPPPALKHMEKYERSSLAPRWAKGGPMGCSRPLRCHQRPARCGSGRRHHQDGRPQRSCPGLPR